jgi:hypothetical protein
MPIPDKIENLSKFTKYIDNSQRTPDLQYFAFMAFNYMPHPMKRFSNLELILPVLCAKVWVIFVYNGSFLVSM